MRRRMVKLLVLCILLGLTSCSSKNDSNSSSDQSLGSGSYYQKNSSGLAATHALTNESTGSSGTSNSSVASEVEALDGMEYADNIAAIDSNEFNTEEYNAITENGYKSTKNYPISTLSADVDTASYSNVRRMIMNGERVVADAVRIEEMINYFQYDYENPRGEDPFSITTEITNCPWNEDTKLMMVGLKTKDIDFSETVNSNLVFLIDVSGSMYDTDKLPLVQQAFTMLVENLTEKDRISIVTYAGDDRVVLSGVTGDQKYVIKEAIEELEASGSTAGSKGIETAYQLAESNFISGGNNRVILAKDGDLNVGVSSEGELTDLISEKKKSGVYLSVLGFGTGNYKDNKLEALADNGNGNYSYIDTVKEAKKVLVEEMSANFVTVAEDVKIQLEFNPAMVKGYRLIGYENRLLNTEDFEDDTKDAGEIGAGHVVTVLYELVLTDSKLEVPETDLKYQNNEVGSNSNEYVTINIRYKNPGQDNSKLMSKAVDEKYDSSESSDNLTFASAVAQFGMLLRDSAYKGTASYQGIIDSLNKVDLRSDEYKQEFLMLVQQASLNEYYRSK